MYAAAALVGIGCLAVLRGLRLLSRQTRSWPAWALTYLVVFRRVVVGACSIGAGLGLADRIDWLLAASICVGVGELLESSYYIGVLRYGGVRSIGLLQDDSALPPTNSTHPFRTP
jgi:hypothetical protein